MSTLTKIRRHRYRIAAVTLAAYWILIFTGTHLPSVPSLGAGVNDKTKHYVAFFGLGMLLCLASSGRPGIRRFGTVAAIAIGYGVVDELTQMLVPGRHCDPYDVLADATGALTAIGLYAAASLYRRRGVSNRRRGASSGQLDD